MPFGRTTCVGIKSRALNSFSKCLSVLHKSKAISSWMFKCFTGLMKKGGDVYGPHIGKKKRETLVDDTFWP